MRLLLLLLLHITPSSNSTGPTSRCRTEQSLNSHSIRCVIVVALNARSASQSEAITIRQVAPVFCRCWSIGRSLKKICRCLAYLSRTVLQCLLLLFTITGRISRMIQSRLLSDVSGLAGW